MNKGFHAVVFFLILLGVITYSWAQESSNMAVSTNAANTAVEVNASESAKNMMEAVNNAESVNEEAVENVEDVVNDEAVPVTDAEMTDGDLGEGAVIASAYIEGTTGHEDLFGEITFIETPDGVSAQAEVYNVPNVGKHGFHIHENGNCNANGESAGGHFNPNNVDHGDIKKDGVAKAHIGDMGNIEIDDKGEGFLTTFIPGATLTGEKNNILGKAVIMHEKQDDFGQPTGNAGGRIACGVIEMIE